METEMETKTYMRCLLHGHNGFVLTLAFYLAISGHSRLEGGGGGGSLRGFT